MSLTLSAVVGCSASAVSLRCGVPCGAEVGKAAAYCALHASVPRVPLPLRGGSCFILASYFVGKKRLSSERGAAEARGVLEIQYKFTQVHNLTNPGFAWNRGAVSKFGSAALGSSSLMSDCLSPPRATPCGSQEATQSRRADALSWPSCWPC